MHRVRNAFLALLLPAVALAIWAGGETGRSGVPALPALPASSLKPGPYDPRIALVAARLLENNHYLQEPLDGELSKKFFDCYVDSLDPRHENFLQSDLDEFAVYRTNLDKLTLEAGTSDLTPAFAVYNRFAERVEQHDAYVMNLLKQDKFKFNTDEQIVLDRRHAPFPANLVEAEALWKQQLRYEYLQEKLSREIVETNDTLVIRLPADAAKDITAKLESRYRWNLLQTTNWDSSAVLQLYLNGLCHAYDPHTDYMSAPHAQDFSISMNLSLFGIGATLGEDDGYCTIRSLVPGGPAAKSKQLNENDRIVAVAQGANPPVDVVDMELEKVVQQIRGPKGTEVRLTLSPATDRSARPVVKLIRDEIKLEDSEAKAKLIEYPDGRRIGVIDLPSFYATVNLGNNGNTTPKYTSVDVAKLVNRLKREKVSGIIIDLRTNPGGSLEEAIKFTGLFIKSGPVVLARNSDNQVQVDTVPGDLQLYDGPLLVMINRFSASASEIAAAALQDYGRALIVGDISTHGKGTVQSLNPLRPFPGTGSDTSDPGNLKITIRKFYRVSGASTQFKGVEPDIVLPDVLNFSKQVGEASLDNPLPWDTIQPVNYDKLNLVQPYLPTLKEHSDERIATNQDFLYVKQDIEQFVKLQADKTATVNERESIKDRQRAFLLNQTREAERAARKPDGVKVFDITVENADQPGLTLANADTTSNAIASNAGSNTVTSASDLSKGIIAASATVAAKKSAPPFDPIFDESQRILLDYISLLGKSNRVAVSQ